MNIWNILMRVISIMTDNRGWFDLIIQYNFKNNIK
jgi:hypothetical protein